MLRPQKELSIKEEKLALLLESVALMSVDLTQHVVSLFTGTYFEQSKFLVMKVEELPISSKAKTSTHRFVIRY